MAVESSVVRHNTVYSNSVQLVSLNNVRGFGGGIYSIDSTVESNHVESNLLSVQGDAGQPP